MAFAFGCQAAIQSVARQMLCRFMPLPVLFILHQEHSTPGRVAQALKSRGFTFDIRRPRFGDPLPETLEQHTGAVIFGGPMSANDEEEFVRREIEWLKVPLKEEKPFLGICLGAQILARHLGSTRSEERRVGNGYGA